jgi:predicted amidohydrolase
MTHDGGKSMKFDLVVAGGEVLDPGAGLAGVMDIGIVGGKIAAVAPSLSSRTPCAR